MKQRKTYGDIEGIRQRLLELADEKYAAFHRCLVPTADGRRIIGVRMPQLRRLSRELSAEEAACLLAALPHHYYEEYVLHGLLINDMRDFDQAMIRLEELLPWVDNWALCDLLRPRVPKKELPHLMARIPGWLASPHTYTKRFGLSALMNCFLSPPWTEQALDMAAAVRTDEYYVEMMTAWLFATALAKDWEAAVPYLEQRKLQPWTHNKAIQKARESRRLTDEQKAYLNTLKVDCPAGLRVSRGKTAVRKEKNI